jgi:hypothetical protein
VFIPPSLVSITPGLLCVVITLWILPPHLTRPSGHFNLNLCWLKLSSLANCALGSLCLEHLLRNSLEFCLRPVLFLRLYVILCTLLSNCHMCVLTPKYRSLPSSFNPSPRSEVCVSVSCTPTPASPLIPHAQHDWAACLLPHNPLGLSRCLCSGPASTLISFPKQKPLSLPWKSSFQSSPTPNSGLHCVPNHPCHRHSLNFWRPAVTAAPEPLSAPEWLSCGRSECHILRPLQTPPVPHVWPLSCLLRTHFVAPYFTFLNTPYPPPPFPVCWILALHPAADSPFLPLQLPEQTEPVWSSYLICPHLLIGIINWSCEGCVLCSAMLLSTNRREGGAPYISYTSDSDWRLWQLWIYCSKQLRMCF